MSNSIVPPAEDHRADGWEADTPNSDTLVRMAAHVQASWPTAVASDEGRPVHEAMGYVAIERWTAWLRPAS